MECEMCRKEFPDCAMERHHKDGDKKNNNPKNIAVICRACHDLIHKFSKPRLKLPKLPEDSVLVKRNTLKEILRQVEDALVNVQAIKAEIHGK